MSAGFPCGWAAQNAAFPNKGFRALQILVAVGQSLLYSARKFLLPPELKLRVFLSHAQLAVSSDFRGFDA